MFILNNEPKINRVQVHIYFFVPESLQVYNFIYINFVPESLQVYNFIYINFVPESFQ